MKNKINPGVLKFLEMAKRALEEGVSRETAFGVSEVEEVHLSFKPTAEDILDDFGIKTAVITKEGEIIPIGKVKKG